MIFVDSLQKTNLTVILLVITYNHSKHNLTFDIGYLTLDGHIICDKFSNSDCIVYEKSSQPTVWTASL